jgi:hypothetical protein
MEFMDMDNIKFSYLYRDAGNYKKWANVVFSNTRGLPVESIRNNLERSFLQDGLFIAHQVRVPDAFFAVGRDSTVDDHCFHEFDAVATTLEIPDDLHARSIDQFIAEVKREAGRGWIAFELYDASREGAFKQG